MTREVARIKVEQLDNYLSHTCQDYGERDHEAMMMAIKALEQEPILDKIRAEVENINVWGMRYNPDTDKDRKPQIVQKVKEHVIEILDKYKAESEPQESEE